MSADNENGSHSQAAFRNAAIDQLESLHRFAFHLSRDPALAEDLVQETYVLALRHEHTYNRRLRDIRPWLFKILNNAMRKHFRRESLVTSREDLDEAHADPAVPNSELLPPNSRLQDLDWEQIDDSLKHAIDALPETLRSAFLLFAVEDLKYRDIAEIEGIPIGTVMSRLSRARKLLMQSLASNPTISGN